MKSYVVGHTVFSSLSARQNSVREFRDDSLAHLSWDIDSS